MTLFEIIEARRRDMDSRLCEQAEAAMFAADPPEWCQVNTRQVSEYNRDGGVTFQRCGGGRRVIRKRIGGSR